MDRDSTIDCWRAWADLRPPPRGLHVDTAAAGRSSYAVQEATAAHALLESQAGAYVAQAEAAPALAAGRAAAARLLGVHPDGLAYLESASAALAALLQVWPLPEAARVAVVPSEWGPNLEAFGQRGMRIVELAVDAVGRVDLEALERQLVANPPAAVHLTQVASHRGLVQPIAGAAALCRAAGVPLWVDAAQALGHVATDTGADAIYATGRKWLAGPRGVGVLGVAERWWDSLGVPRSAMTAGDEPVVQLLESHEAHVAGRVGLGVALAQYVEAGPELVAARLAEVGRQTRGALCDLAGWQVADDHDSGSAIIALRPTAGQDVSSARARLLEEGIVTTAGQPARAPREMTGALLRISPHVDCSDDALSELRAALGRCAAAPRSALRLSAGCRARPLR